MAYEIGTAQGHYDLLTKLRIFLEATLPVGARWIPQTSSTQSLGTVSSITRSGTTATVTLSAATGLQSLETVVIAGASDALYNGTFVVTVLTTTTFTYVMTGTPSASASGTLTAGRNFSVIWSAPGLAGIDQIYTGVETYESIPSDYFNFKVAGFTGYVPGNAFTAQPGISATNGVPLWNQAIPYWFVANAQRCIVFAKVQNNYNSFHIGKYLPYATPGQYPYPILIGGMLATNSATRYSDTAYVSWWKGSAATLSLRFVDGSYKNPTVNAFSGAHIFRNTIASSGTSAGYYGLHPLVLSDLTPNTYGEVDGIYLISGFDNAVENTIVVSGVTYVILRDVTRTGLQDYIALKLA
jgi:hypothetical protein